MKRIINIAIVVSAISLGTAELEAQSGPYEYFTVTPCRIVDTRNPVGTNGGPILGTTKRDFSIRGNCGIPMTAKAVTANVTVAYPSAWSWLTVWPSGAAMPFISTVNYDTNGSVVANGALLSLSTNTNDLSVTNANGTCHVIIDVTGYYQ